MNSYQPNEIGSNGPRVPLPALPYGSYSLYRRLPTRCAFEGAFQCRAARARALENFSLRCHVVEPLSQAITPTCWKIAMFPHGMSSHSLATMSKSPRIDTN